jgi:hypothetical protein
LQEAAGYSVAAVIISSLKKRIVGLERRFFPDMKKYRVIPFHVGDLEDHPSWRQAFLYQVQEFGIVSKSGSDVAVVDANTAATKIQSAYRGYVVRRTKPMEHLRVIRKVRSELRELECRAAKPGQFDELCKDEQERRKWTEQIMTLLLRLDSIQDAHPVVRNIRRSLAKEVIQFQEIIDASATDFEPQKKPDQMVRVPVPFYVLRFRTLLTV